MDAKVFEQVSTELVRVNSVEGSRLYALYFNEERGDLENVHLSDGIHALAERCGAAVTVNPMFPGRGMYECRIGDVLYTQSVPNRPDGEEAAFGGE